MVVNLQKKLEFVKSLRKICDWIYGNRSKSHIGNYEIIDFKDFKALKPARDCEHANETFTEGRPFHCV